MRPAAPSLLFSSFLFLQGGGYAQQTAAQAQAQSESLRAFWAQQMREVQAVGTDPAEFKNHQLPLARIKKARNGRGTTNLGRSVHPPPRPAHSLLSPLHHRS